MEKIFAEHAIFYHYSLEKSEALDFTSHKVILSSEETSTLLRVKSEAPQRLLMFIFPFILIKISRIAWWFVFFLYLCTYKPLSITI